MQTNKTQLEQEPIGAADAARGATPPPAKPSPDTDVVSKKEKPEKPTREEHPAVALYRSLCAKQLNNVQVEMLEKMNPPLDILERAITEWKAAGNRPTNVKGVLDWVKHPERMGGYQAPSNKKSGIFVRPEDVIPVDEAEQEAMRQWAREAYPERFAHEKEQE